MSMNEIARAWKDERYRATLSEEARAALPPNPAGAIELPDEALNEDSGGASWHSFCRTICGVYCILTRDYNCFPESA
jgi:mersacidin/lichenicidin family type 2 lantibiotic